MSGYSMFLLDLTHTSHTRARTGIQQVCRSFHAALQEKQEGCAVTHDPYRRQWRSLERWEEAALRDTQPTTKRGAHWPMRRRLFSRLARHLQRVPTALPRSEGLIVPELFSAGTAAALPSLFAAVAGPKIALFHDAIALKLPELSPPKTVARFPAYLRDLLQFDGIAAVSEDSRQSLVDYWRWLGLRSHPPVVAIALPLLRGRPASASLGTAFTPTPPRPCVLSVGTLEGRKNHLALLEACEDLWAHGLDFELRLIGFAQKQTGAAALQRIAQLQAKGRALRFEGAVEDAVLDRAYREATFTVYPSLMEGFGLPVLESLSYGKPCICSARGALGESASGGGCITVDTSAPGQIAQAMHSLLPADQNRLMALTSEANRRTFRSWPDYLREMKAWMLALS